MIKNETQDPRMKIFAGAAIVLAALGLVFISINGDFGSQTAGSSKIEAKEKNYDFGDVSMAKGVVKHTFEIKNSGSGNLKISEIKTSCMCTSAVLDIDGKKSPAFSLHNNPMLWSDEIAAGQTAKLEVAFDPNAHGPDATGPITRTISMRVNGSEEEVFTITGNVIK